MKTGTLKNIFSVVFDLRNDESGKERRRPLLSGYIFTTEAMMSIRPHLSAEPDMYSVRERQDAQNVVFK